MDCLLVIWIGFEDLCSRCKERCRATKCCTAGDLESYTATYTVRFINSYSYTELTWAEFDLSTMRTCPN